MVKVRYTPKRGDLVWLNFQPQSGREQSGRKPAVVISNTNYNIKVGLAIFCPITSSVKGYPFEIELPKSVSINGVVLVDQVKSLDWQKRDAEFIDKLDNGSLERIISLLGIIIES